MRNINKFCRLRFPEGKLSVPFFTGRQTVARGESLTERLSPQQDMDDEGHRPAGDEECRQP